MGNKLIAKNSEGKIIEYCAIFKDKNYYCSGKNLTEIISIPNDLGRLHCRNNKLTSLPEVLSKDLEVLRCQNNNIKQLPNLKKYKKLTYVSCDIICLEDYMFKMKNVDFEFFC